MDKATIGSKNFFHSFADDFDGFYTKKRSKLLKWIDQKFRSDMYIRFALTFEHLGDLTGKRLIDIGCGTGVYVERAFKNGAAFITGIDHAQRMIELTEERVKNVNKSADYESIVGTFPDDLPAGTTWDDAIVMGVMDYIADPVIFLKALAGCITRRAVLSFPSKHWFRTPVRRFRYNLRKCPLYIYNKIELVKTLEASGIKNYEIIKIPGAGMDFVVVINK